MKPKAARVFRATIGVQKSLTSRSLYTHFSRGQGTHNTPFAVSSTCKKDLFYVVREDDSTIDSGATECRLQKLHLLCEIPWNTPFTIISHSRQISTMFCLQQPLTCISATPEQGSPSFLAASPHPDNPSSCLATTLCVLPLLHFAQVVSSLPDQVWPDILAMKQKSKGHI